MADVIDRIAMLEMSDIVGLGHSVRSMEFPFDGAQAISGLAGYYLKEPLPEPQLCRRLHAVLGW